jgi:hypothetical protein
MADYETFPKITDTVPKFTEYNGKTYTATDVRMYCVRAMMYFLDHYGKEKIDIKDFYKEVGL